MSLFKIFRGQEEGLASVPKHEGYAYFTEDKGNLFIDISSDIPASEGVEAQAGVRVQVNAEGAKYLLDGATKISVDDLFLTNMMASVTQGGTGHSTLTTNALIVGNGTDSVKLVSINNGEFVVGDSENGVKGITSAVARTNLDVYSKTETDEKIEQASSVEATEETLTVAGWTASEDKFTQTLTMIGLTCGKEHNVPPVIAPVSNIEEYSKIESAVATPAESKTADGTIVFTIAAKPATEIKITVTDVK